MRCDDEDVTRNMLCYINISQLVWSIMEKYIALHKKAC